MKISNKISRVRELVDNINRLTKRLLGSSNTFFDDMYLDLEEKESHEHTFIWAVSWFYVLYFESAGIDLKFLKIHLKNNGYSDEGYLNEIDSLRTYYQHNLNPNDASDLDKIYTVEEYFDGIRDKNGSTFWDKCVLKLYNDSIQYLESILATLEDIKSDTEYKKAVTLDWKSKRNNSLPFEKVKKIVERKCEELGLTFYDYKRLSKKNYEEWLVKIKDFDNAISLEKALSKLIETELSERKHLPINGDDIIKHFQISEGKKVGEYLSIAQKEFKISPCGKRELLHVINEKMN